MAGANMRWARRFGLVTVLVSAAALVAMFATAAGTGLTEEMGPTEPSGLLAPALDVPDVQADRPSDGGSVHHQALRYGPAPHQVLDLIAATHSERQPLVVYAHHGGWVTGSRTDPLPAVLLNAIDAGWAVASIDYQLASEDQGSFPDNVHDFKRATRWLRANADLFGLDALVVVAAGASAGGHLVALAVTTAGQVFEPDLNGDLAAADPFYQGLITLVAPLDLEVFDATDHPWSNFAGQMLGCRELCTAGQFAAASPVTYASADTPLAYVAAGGLDDLVTPVHAHGFAGASPRVVVDINDLEGHNLTDGLVDLVAFGGFLDAIRTSVPQPDAGPTAMDGGRR